MLQAQKDLVQWYEVMSFGYEHTGNPIMYIKIKKMRINLDYHVIFLIF